MIKKQKKTSKERKTKVKIIKSKAKIIEKKELLTTSSSKSKEIKKKNSELKTKIEDSREEVGNKFTQFFQPVKAPVLEKIARVEEPNLEQIAFVQTNRKKDEKGVDYTSTKLDYDSIENRGLKENDTKYTESSLGSSLDYESVIKNDKRDRENITMFNQFDKNKRKKDVFGFEPEAESKKYMTKRDYQ